MSNVASLLVLPLVASCSACVACRAGAPQATAVASSSANCSSTAPRIATRCSCRRAQAGGRRPPVILFLHGSGERGDDNQRQTEVGLGPHVRKHLADFPAIVVFPQAPEGAVVERRHCAHGAGRARCERARVRRRRATASS